VKTNAIIALNRRGANIKDRFINSFLKNMMSSFTDRYFFRILCGGYGK
jgi:hypothetical protein